MADNTPYHNFNRFDKLESWDYNPDFEKLDERLELRGSLADRPSSAPDGAKFVVDDPADAEHGTTYIYDTGASTWNAQPVQAPSVDTEHLDFIDDTLDAPVEIGVGSSVGDDRGIAVGKNADAGGSSEGTESIAIGVGATATPDLSGNGESDAIAIGRNAKANQLRTIAIGGYDDGNAQGAEATEDDAIAIGANSEASGDDCISIGQGSQATSSTTNGSVAMGKQARATKELGVAIGVVATAFGAEGTAVGAGAGADSLRSVAIGRNAAASNDATAIGRGTNAGANNSVAIGSQTSVSTASLARIGGEVNQFVWPGTRDTVADADLKNNELTVELDETNAAFRLRGKDSGGNIREATVAW